MSADECKRIDSTFQKHIGSEEKKNQEIVFVELFCIYHLHIVLWLSTLLTIARSVNPKRSIIEKKRIKSIKTEIKIDIQQTETSEKPQYTQHVFVTAASI